MNAAEFVFAAARPGVSGETHASYTLPGLLAAATRLAAQPGLAERLPVVGDQRAWLMLDAGAGVQAWLIAWPSGTGTGWHDHGGAAGAMVAVAGELTERSVLAPADHDYGRALALPNATGRVRLLPAGRGRAFSGRHIHEVTNEGPVTAYSVHVYSPTLPLMRHYVPSGETLILVGVESRESGGPGEKRWIGGSGRGSEEGRGEGRGGGGGWQGATRIRQPQPASGGPGHPGASLPDPPRRG
jgi:cysteine dioxygenase type I